MPKTYTDDVAAALPSSIDGPFQIVDPSDSTSWIKIDPAGARISTAGNARPTRVLNTGFVRTSGMAQAQSISSYIAARYVNPTYYAGFFLAPINIPEDMDVTQPCSVKILVSPLNDATANGQVIRFNLNEASITQGGSVSSMTVTYDWSVPDNWTISDFNVILIDNGNGCTYDGDTFANRDIIGLHIVRNGPAAQDTFNKAVKIAEFLQIEYTVNKY